MGFIKKYRALLIATFFLLASYLLTLLLPIVLQGDYWEIKDINVRVSVSTVRGFCQAFVLTMGIIVACIDYRRGTIIAASFICASIFGMFRGLLIEKDSSVIPGISNSFISLFSIFFIGYQMKKREMLALMDDLTGLYNKRGLERMLADLAGKRKLSAIAFVQVMDFRDINDNLGHECGDFALRTIAERMKVALDKVGYAAHTDGTEFAVALYDCNDVPYVCSCIIDAVSEKIVFDKNGATINGYLSAYIGVSLYGTDAKDVDSLMKYADIASYNAVKDRKNKVVFFSQEMLDSSIRRAEIIANVKESLEKNYFYLVYQPQYQISYKSLRGFEALLRCKLPDGTMLSPGEFIPIAEKTNLILDIDKYVFRRALNEFQNVLSETNNDFRLSINVSAKSMSSPDFARYVEKILRETNFPAKNLEVEITEYSFSESEVHTYNNVMDLRDLGVQIAIDDFGTGYTSLEQLLKLPVNLLKVDKSLIDYIESRRVNRDFIDSVIYMGHLIGCDVIAEGVELESQLQLLKDHNCDYVQGYVWSKPLPFEDAKALLG